jgi:mRNA-degrading endonuclease RelE of RelBE toxin-antitoxin system
MTFRVKLSSQATKFLEKLDLPIAERIKTALIKLTETPFAYVEHFEGRDYHKFRIGDYRALVDIDTTNRIALVRILEHRSKIYKR